MTRLFGLAAISVAALMASAALGQDTTITGSVNPGQVLEGQAAFGDTSQDAPGVTRHIRAADLQPAGNPDQSEAASPDKLPFTDQLKPVVPDGFTATLVAQGIENPRAIRFAPNGDLFVSNSEPGQVLVYHWADGATEPTKSVFAEGLNQPYGVAFYPAENPEWVYIAESNGLKRFPYKAGDTVASAAPETLFDNIDPEHHWTRDVAFSPDGKTMYYSVGSGSNVGTDMTMELKPAGESVEQWASTHPLGVAWGGEERRAAVLSYTPDGKDEAYYGTGLRNCAGMTVQPQTGDVWCVVNERDELGNNVPFDYATSVKQGAFYGWPWFYIGDHADPRWAETPRQDIANEVTTPDVLFQAHSAPLNIAFYEGDQFGPDYKGDAFVAMHGSWNRGQPTGYKVVKLEMDANGKPTGDYTDFATGFVLPDGKLWGRPVGVAVAPDGSLYVSEDGNGTIWRISKTQ